MKLWSLGLCCILGVELFVTTDAAAKNAVAFHHLAAAAAAYGTDSGQAHKLASELKLLQLRKAKTGYLDLASPPSDKRERSHLQPAAASALVLNHLRLPDSTFDPAIVDPNHDWPINGVGANTLPFRILHYWVTTEWA